MVATNNAYIIDASFLLNRLLDERPNLKVFDILNQFEDKEISLYAPFILKIEVCNALKSAVKQNRRTTKEVYIIFEAFLDMGIIFKTPDYKQTLQLSIKHDLSYYDALYLALSKQLHHPLLTLDKKLASLTK